LERFHPDIKDPVHEFKQIQQNGKVEDYIKNYERVKARVMAK
jgi:hypothetical protein